MRLKQDLLSLRSSKKHLSEIHRRGRSEWEAGLRACQSGLPIRLVMDISEEENIVREAIEDCRLPSDVNASERDHEGHRDYEDHRDYEGHRAHKRQRTLRSYRGHRGHSCSNKSNNNFLP